MSRTSWTLAVLGAALATVFFLFADSGLSPAVRIALKGSGVGLLALAAAIEARSASGWLLAAVMAFGAAGDVVLEINWIGGAALFALGHLSAIVLNVRNRRSPISMPVSQKAAALALLLSAPVLVLLAGEAATVGVGVYAALLAIMAACAWTSRFSRYRTGIGAVLFLISDGLIFARTGGQIDPSLAAWLIWPTYFVGQLLIFIGVREGLGRGY
jgi:uncharacterized membrane protein YhhN